MNKESVIAYHYSYLDRYSRYQTKSKEKQYFIVLHQDGSIKLVDIEKDEGIDAKIDEETADSIFRVLEENQFINSKTETREIFGPYNIVALFNDKEGEEKTHRVNFGDKMPPYIVDIIKRLHAPFASIYQEVTNNF